MGYTVVISGKMKCALLSVLPSSLLSLATLVFCVGRNLERRPKRVCGGGGGRFNIDFPGVGIVTADDEGDGEEDISAPSRANPKCRAVTELD